MASRADGRRSRTSGLAWAVLGGAFFAAVGFVVAFALLQDPVLGLFVPAGGIAPSLVALASFLAGGSCWWLVVERPHLPTRGRGAVAGLLTGLLVHPVTWVLVFAYEDASAYADPSKLLSADGLNTLLGAVALFTFFSWLIVGPVTVAVGVVAGLAFAAVHRRIEPFESMTAAGDEGTRYWLANAIVLGVTVILLSSLVGLRGLLVLGTSGLAAGAVTLAALRRLPVVRTFFAQTEDSSTAALSNRSFRYRYGLGMVGLGATYVLAFFGYAYVLDYLYRAILSSARIEVDYDVFSSILYGYPVFFAGLCLLVALALNYRRNRWRPYRSALRPVLEWGAFFVLAVAIYTLAWAVWLSWR